MVLIIYMLYNDKIALSIKSCSFLNSLVPITGCKPCSCAIIIAVKSIQILHYHQLSFIVF